MKVVGSIALLLLSSVFALLVAEVLSRVIVDPIDYLRPTLVFDPYLNHVIEANSASHDKWGFRNPNVPETVTIVAIGDSMTYGESAKSTQSWPVLLSNESGRSVYNMGLGGYGPIQYAHLVRTKAIRLNPELVIVALYLGNDVLDAFNMAYGNTNWVDFRQSDYSDVVDPTSLVPIQFNKSRDDRVLGGLRQYLSQTSLLYRLVTQGSLGQMLRRQEMRISRNRRNVTQVVEFGTQLDFNPSYRYPALDVEDSKVREGIAITKKAISRISADCLDNEVQLLVAIIPTKELVYASRLDGTTKDDLSEDLRRVIQNEIAVKQDVLEFLTDQGIGSVDTLGALRDASKSRVVYPTSDDHPNESGYKAIAQQIASHQLVSSTRGKPESVSRRSTAAAH